MPCERVTGGQRIKPHTLHDSSVAERVLTTLGEALEEYDSHNYWQVRDCGGNILGYYNDGRLNSGINYLRPVDYCRGRP